MDPEDDEKGKESAETEGVPKPSLRSRLEARGWILCFVLAVYFPLTGSLDARSDTAACVQSKWVAANRLCVLLPSLCQDQPQPLPLASACTGADTSTPLKLSARARAAGCRDFRLLLLYLQDDTLTTTSIVALPLATTTTTTASSC